MYHVRYKDMAMKPKRTLGPAAFEAYMNFADSLKNGANNDSIDRFKYRFAVKEGYIRPKKAMTESAGGLSLGDFETAFKGLVGGFLPHLDEEEQQFLGCVCSALDEKINSGDLSGAADVIKGAMNDAGGTDEYEDDACEDGECEECQDDDECPEGEECQDGECVESGEDEQEKPEGENKKLTEAKLNNYGTSKFHPEDNCPHLYTKADKINSKYLEDPDNSNGVSDVDNTYDADGELEELNFEECCCGKKANAGKPKVDSINSTTPGFGLDDTAEYELDDDYGAPVDDIFADNGDLDVVPRTAGGVSDYSEDFSAPEDVDYDQLADMILSDNGYGTMTTENGGVGSRNHALMSR